MATKYIDNVVVNTVSYGTSSEDIRSNDTRTLKIENDEISNIVVEAYLGELTNGKIVKLSSKGANVDGNIMAFDATFFINADNGVSNLGNINAHPGTVEGNVHANVTSDEDEEYLRVTGPEGVWSSLVTII